MISIRERVNPLDYAPLDYVAFATCPKCKRMMTIKVTHGIPAEPIYCIHDRDEVLTIPDLIADDLVHSPARA